MEILSWIKLFLFISSLLFVLRYVVEIGYKMAFNYTDEPITLSKTGQVFLLLTISYIITYLILH